MQEECGREEEDVCVTNIPAFLPYFLLRSLKADHVFSVCWFGLGFFFLRNISHDLTSVTNSLFAEEDWP